MIYLYAITEEANLPEDSLGGLDHLPVHSLVHRDLRGVYSHLSGSSVDPTPLRLWQHERVVEALMAKGPLIPSRFSTLLEDEEDLERLIEENYSSLHEELDRFRGRVALALRVVRLTEDPVVEVALDPEHVAGGDGCPAIVREDQADPDYLLLLRAVDLQRDLRRMREDSFRDRVHAALAGLAFAHVIREEGRGGTLLSASYLVDASRVPAMQGTLEQLVAEHSSLHFLCTGPWPPYHFTDVL